MVQNRGIFRRNTRSRKTRNSVHDRPEYAKEAYIAKFNHMEAELSKPVPAPADHQYLDYQFLTTVSGGQVTHVRMARPGEMFASFDYFQEMAKRAGYLIIHSDDIKNMTLENIVKAGENARILSKKFLKN